MNFFGLTKGLYLSAVANWIADSFPIIRIIFIVLMSLIGLALIGIVLLQQGNSEGLGAISGGSDTFFGKNKGKTLDGRLKRLTIILSISMFVIAVLFFITVAIYPVGQIA